MSISLGQMLPFGMPSRVDYLFWIPAAKKPFSVIEYLFGDALDILLEVADPAGKLDACMCRPWLEIPV